MDISKLKPKGLERHKIKWQTKLDLKLRNFATKPTVARDKFNEFLMWFQGFAVDIATESIRNVIPGWFWIAILVVIVIVGVLL